MLDQSTRKAILELHARGVGTRRIAKLLAISRNSVREVLQRGVSNVPRLSRTEKAQAFRDEILRLYSECEGNLIRVHEELLARGARFSYPALTAFCRKHGIGKPHKLPVGNYHFRPGEEMQHDTSPHRLRLGGQHVLVQTASLVLCYSRMLFFQMYPRFDRFTCKSFLTDALAYIGGACKTCMIDNTHVVVLRGTGREMVPVRRDWFCEVDLLISGRVERGETDQPPHGA